MIGILSFPKCRVKKVKVKRRTCNNNYSLTCDEAILMYSISKSRNKKSEKVIFSVKHFCEEKSIHCKDLSHIQLQMSNLLI